ncbi:MAG: hypothetical protein R3250_07655 [Melioribacteraceae bacterium]|nr:hypothetical protein [Melioribacteraceae bacterium]
MKTKNLKFGLLLFVLMMTVFNCSEDNNDPAPQDTQQQQLQNEAAAGIWIISNFVDSGTDETNDFVGFVFDFQANGDLVATSSTVTYTGTWSITDSNSNDDSTDDLHFNIYFNLTNDFEDLNDDWDIISYSSTSIVLQDVSGGNGGIDDLTFTKM